MSQHITRYKTENGKTRRIKNSPAASAKGGNKNKAPEKKPGDEATNQPDDPAK